MRQVQLRCSELGWRVFRNNVSVAWVGEAVNVGDTRHVLLKNARRMKTGLCVGSADLIGWDEQGRFVALEIKTTRGRPTKEQLNFIAAVNAACGYGAIVRSLDDLPVPANNPAVASRSAS